MATVDLLMKETSAGRAKRHDVREGEAEFALVEHEELLLFCYRFGTAIPWRRAIYDAEAEATHRPLDAGRPVAERALLHAQLTVDDTVLATRNVTLPLDFTRAIDRAIREQAKTRYDPRDRRRALGSLDRRFPTVEALVSRAIVRACGCP